MAFQRIYLYTNHQIYFVIQFTFWLLLDTLPIFLYFRSFLHGFQADQSKEQG